MQGKGRYLVVGRAVMGCAEGAMQEQPHVVTQGQHICHKDLLGALGCSPWSTDSRLKTTGTEQGAARGEQARESNGGSSCLSRVLLNQSPKQEALAKDTGKIPVMLSAPTEHD